MITPGIVVFDPSSFKTDFPEFATVSDAALNRNFTFAQLQLNNSIYSVVQDEPTRALLLDLLTAHITVLLNGTNGAPPSGAVGRLADASEGTVRARLEYVAESESAAYYAQTQYGAMFWRSTLRYRNARYVTGNPSQEFGPSWGAWPE